MRIDRNNRLEGCVTHWEMAGAEKSRVGGWSGQIRTERVC